MVAAVLNILVLLSTLVISGQAALHAIYIKKCGWSTLLDVAMMSFICWSIDPSIRCKGRVAQTAPASPSWIVSYSDRSSEGILVFPIAIQHLDFNFTVFVYVILLKQTTTAKESIERIMSL